MNLQNPKIVNRVILAAIVVFIGWIGIQDVIQHRINESRNPRDWPEHRVLKYKDSVYHVYTRIDSVFSIEYDPPERPY